MKKLIDIFQEDKEKPKRTNSMTPLRPHSQTIDSKATRASSIKRENSGLIKQSSEKNIMKIKDKNNNKIEKEIKIEETNKFQNLTEEKNDGTQDNSQSFDLINEKNKKLKKGELNYLFFHLNYLYYFFLYLHKL